MKKAVLLAAWGVGNPHARFALSNFESLCRSRFGLPIRWAYTSGILRERIAKERQKSDSVAKALLRLHYEKFSAVAIQPLQTIPGREYAEVQSTMKDVANQTGLKLSLGAPLLHDNLPEVAKKLILRIPAERKPEECVIFMGHGGRHQAESLYLDLSEELAKIDPRCFVGTMSPLLNLADLMPRLNSRPVWLAPLLASIGQHALRDMSGPAADSWKSRLEACGHECRPVLAGMVESPGLAAIWLDHLESAIARLN